MSLKNYFAHSKHLTEHDEKIEEITRKLRNLQMDYDDLYSKMEIFFKRWNKRAKSALDKELPSQEEIPFNPSQTTMTKEQINERIKALRILNPARGR